MVEGQRSFQTRMRKNHSSVSRVTVFRPLATKAEVERARVSFSRQLKLKQPRPAVLRPASRHHQNVTRSANDNVPILCSVTAVQAGPWLAQKKEDIHPRRRSAGGGGQPRGGCCEVVRQVSLCLADSSSPDSSVSRAGDQQRRRGVCP